MINTNRSLDIAIFCPNKKKVIQGVEILPGLQQLFHKNGNYYFAKINEKPYAVVSEKFNSEVIKTVFSSEIIDP